MAKAGDAKSIVYSNLPEEILPGPNLNPEQSETYLRGFLMQTVPKGDVQKIKSALKWHFLLDKHSFSRKSRLRKKKTFLTRKERAEMNLLKLPKDKWSYVSLEPLRKMWREYMKQNLEVVEAPDCTDQDWTGFSAVVAKSELIGAEMTVVKSKVPNQIGMTGTVVLETKMTFQIVTPESKLKILVKDSSVFQFHLDGMHFTVYGKYIMTRPSDRSTKKIRSRIVPDL